MFDKIRTLFYEGDPLGTKENIDFIKQELSSEEKFLESVIKLEKYYKKYKNLLIGLLVFVILAGVGYMGYEWKKQADLEASNLAFEKLLANPADKEALKVLQQKNPRLYQLFLYRQALQTKDKKILENLAKSEDPILSDLAKYHLAVLNKDERALQNYSMQKEALLKEMAILDDGYLLMKSEKIDDARRRLSNIAKESSAYPYALLLKHYGAKVKK